MPGEITLRRNYKNLSRVEVNDYVAYLHENILIQYNERNRLKHSLKMKRDELNDRKLDPYKILFSMIQMEQRIPVHEMPKRQKKYLYYLILFHVHKTGFITNNEFHSSLYRRFSIPRISNVTRMLAKMEEYGLLSLFSVTKGYKRYYITEKGRVYADKIGGLITQYFAPIKVITGNASLRHNVSASKATPTEGHSGVESKEAEVLQNGDTGGI